MFSVYPFPLWLLRKYTLCLIIIIKSEVRTIIHCLGLGHETMVCAICLSIFLFFQKCQYSFMILKHTCSATRRPIIIKNQAIPYRANRIIIAACHLVLPHVLVTGSFSAALPPRHTSLVIEAQMKSAVKTTQLCQICQLSFVCHQRAPINLECLGGTASDTTTIHMQLGFYMVHGKKCPWLLGSG